MSSLKSQVNISDEGYGSPVYISIGQYIAEYLDPADACISFENVDAFIEACHSISDEPIRVSDKMLRHYWNVKQKELEDRITALSYR